MAIKKAFIWSAALLAIFSLSALKAPLFALEGGDSSLYDTVETAKRPTILGLEFGKPSSSLVSTLAAMGVKLTHREKMKNWRKEGLEAFNFNGIPSGAAVREGTTRLVFFQNKLISVDLFFNPTYENFLLLKEQLLQSLGQRFQIDEQKEAMDSHLKAYLATIGKNYGSAAEAAVKRSVIAGKTFFFCRVKDNLAQLNIILSFTGVLEKSANGLGEERVELLLHYEDKQGTDPLRQLIDNKQPEGLLPKL